eukprot:251308-Prorocentrum_minimum.AAC.2
MGCARSLRVRHQQICFRGGFPPLAEGPLKVSGGRLWWASRGPLKDSCTARQILRSEAYEDRFGTGDRGPRATVPMVRPTADDVQLTRRGRCWWRSGSAPAPDERRRSPSASPVAQNHVKCQQAFHMLMRSPGGEHVARLVVPRRTTKFEKVYEGRFCRNNEKH